MLHLKYVTLPQTGGNRRTALDLLWPSMKPLEGRRQPPSSGTMQPPWKVADLRLNYILSACNANALGNARLPKATLQRTIKKASLENAHGRGQQHEGNTYVRYVRNRWNLLFILLATSQNINYLQFHLAYWLRQGHSVGAGSPVFGTESLL